MVEKNNGPLRIKKRKSKLEKNIGRWVAISITGNGTSYGKIKEVEGREITFNPYRGIDFDEKYKCNLWKIISEDADLEVSPNGYFIEKFSEKSLKYLVNKNNEEILKNRNSEKKNN